MTYTLSMRDDGGSTHDVEFDDLPTQAEIREAATDWVQDGEWGDDGAAVDVRYEISDDADEVVDSDCITVDVEPNHDALIRAAGGDPDCDHDWTGEGEGGLDENPGVWATGGTSMLFIRHCRHCGLIRKERSCGSQRNPGEHDTVEYEMPAEANPNFPPSDWWE